MPKKELKFASEKFEIAAFNEGLYLLNGCKCSISGNSSGDS
jgi:hypothetical protein